RARLAEAGIGWARVDMTRGEIGVPVVRVVAAGLATDRPRTGSARMATTLAAFGLPDDLPLLV
ncbi:MAG: hypothetical protein AAFW69_03595, partial [Pseudomonadota bacterium]